MIDYLRDHLFECGCAVLLAAIAAILGVTIYVAIHEERQWQQFKIAHNCKKVGQTGSTVQTGTAIDPATGKLVVVTTSQPGKEGYLCDDGVTYWR